MILNNNIILKIFDKYKFDYDKNILNNDMNEKFIEICKIPNINYKIIKKCIFSNKDLNLKLSYDHILNHFKNANNEDIINYIEIIKLYIKYINNEDIDILICTINIKLESTTDDKKIYSLLKHLLIYINNYSINNKKIIKKNIEFFLKIIKNTDDFKKISYYINKILYYIENNKNICYDTIINVIEPILFNKDIIKNHNIEDLLFLINKCKMYSKIENNDLKKILFRSDKNIFDYVFFLNNNVFVSKDEIVCFLENLNYEKKSFKEIDILNLKRGFIQGLTNNSKDYIIKYQPNKSVMELIINCYIKTLDKNNFLVPKQFFINNDNSYFYVIEKYRTDLYKYFNILESKNKILKFKDIILITKFLMNSIEILHNNNIIHADLKLENIILNLTDNNDNNDINELKIIDFDVSMFNKMPDTFNKVSEKYKKILTNKKPRGTRIYMLKNESMNFNNDIYSFGVILLIILLKNIKLILILKSNSVDDSKHSNNYKILIKKLNNLRDSIEEDKVKKKILTILDNFLKKNNIFQFFDDNQSKFKHYKSLILDCLKPKLNINEIKLKYENLL
jgi:hypothetical protein